MRRSAPRRRRRSRPHRRLSPARPPGALADRARRPAARQRLRRAGSRSHSRTTAGRRPDRRPRLCRGFRRRQAAALGLGRESHCRRARPAGCRGRHRRGGTAAVRRDARRRAGAGPRGRPSSRLASAPTSSWCGAATPRPSPTRSYGSGRPAQPIDSRFLTTLQSAMSSLLTDLCTYLWRLKAMHSGPDGRPVERAT